MKNNCVSINLKKNEIVIKLSEMSSQEEIVTTLNKKIPELNSN